MHSSTRLLVALSVTGVLAGCSSTSSGTAAGVLGGSASKLQSQYEQVVQHVLPSVVQITTNGSTGSGVVYDTSGDIVTNEHVIGTATTVEVRGFGWGQDSDG